MTEFNRNSVALFPFSSNHNTKMRGLCHEISGLWRSSLSWLDSSLLGSGLRFEELRCCLDIFSSLS